MRLLIQLSHSMPLIVQLLKVQFYFACKRVATGVYEGGIIPLPIFLENTESRVSSKRNVKIVPRSSSLALSFVEQLSQYHYFVLQCVGWVHFL